MASTKTVVAFPEGSPGSRICCVLTPDGPIFTETSALDHHFGGSSDVNGEMYTCKAGFLDLGHIRDLADLTLFYYTQLDRLKGAKGAKLDSFKHGSKVIELTVTVAPADYIAVAEAMAYAESIAYEIQTYWLLDDGSWIERTLGIGGHNSSFSPEDLVSNFLGTQVGGRAIADMKAGKATTFDEAAENQIGLLLVAVGGKGGTRARTLDAYGKVDGVWISRPAPGREYYYFDLLRRNFGTASDGMAIEPWIVPGVAGCTDTTWPATIPKAVPASASGSFTAVYEIAWRYRAAFDLLDTQVGSTLDKADFAKKITDIRTHAAKLYGAMYDKPDPLPAP